MEVKNLRNVFIVLLISLQFKIMEDRKLNEKESLELISQMILNSKKKLETTGGSLFLAWGYTTALISLLIFILNEMGQSNWILWLWWLIPIIGYSVMFFVLKKKQKMVTTFIDKVVSYIWIVMGSVCVLLPIVNMFYHIHILFMECILLSIGLLITALVVKIKSLVYGGALGILISFGLLILSNSSYQLLLFALMALVAMIIPGHIVNMSSKKTV